MAIYIHIYLSIYLCICWHLLTGRAGAVAGRAEEREASSESLFLGDLSTKHTDFTPGPCAWRVFSFS